MLGAPAVAYTSLQYGDHHVNHGESTRHWTPGRSTGRLIRRVPIDCGTVVPARTEMLYGYNHI